MSDEYHGVIGIDLGTTYCAVAIFNSLLDEIEIIKDDLFDDADTMPSVISKSANNESKAIVGWAAKNNIINDPKNSVIEVKREMGAIINGEKIKKLYEKNCNVKKIVANSCKGILDEGSIDMICDSSLTYKEIDAKINEMASSQNNKAIKEIPLKIEFNGKWYLPQELSALILLKAKSIAERITDETFNDAVITVPAYFTEIQKKATKEAALLAGLYPRQLIPEPTAAAICYGVDDEQLGKQTYLVYDLGGGTFDVSIIEVEGKSIAVKSTAGDSYLGGGDFDDAITDWAMEQLEINPSDPVVRPKIKKKAEDIKKLLSSVDSAELTFTEIDNNFKPLTITRQKFKELIAERLKDTLTFVKEAIEKAGIDQEQISAILPVGGSSKIPYIKELLVDFFKKDSSFIKTGINPDAVVAQGAAILAKRFKATAEFDINVDESSLKMNQDFNDVSFKLITEHTLSFGARNEQREIVCQKIIHQSANIPVDQKMDRTYYSEPGQPHLEVPIYQGESDYPIENTCIGTLEINIDEENRNKAHEFEITFKLDENGLLEVIAYDLVDKKEFKTNLEQSTSIGKQSNIKDKIDELKALINLEESPNSIDSEPAAGPEDIDLPPPSSDTNEGSATEEAAKAGNELVELKEGVSVYPDFRTYVRRAKKLIEKEFDQELFDKYNAFIKATNEQIDEDSLLDLGDDLVEAYDSKK